MLEFKLGCYTKYSTFATTILWEKLNNDIQILTSEILQPHIHALANLFCNSYVIPLDHF